VAIRPDKYVAQLSHVREVSLLGTADLSFWTNRLAREDLTPAARDGKAQVMIIGAAAKFWGLSFRELSFSIRVHAPDGLPGDNAVYLLSAFNSNRFFTFCERTFFSTPYSHGDVRVSSTITAAIHVLRQGQTFFRAQMSADPATSPEPMTLLTDDVWNGPILLPRRFSRPGDNGRFFTARITGHAHRRPFRSSHDSLEISPSPEMGSLQALIGSGFAATEWLVRPDAMHTKSKTEKRPAPIAGAIPRVNRIS
jgi:hypothetical protein